MIKYAYATYCPLFIPRQHAMYAQRDTVMANPPVCPSVQCQYCT